MKRSLFALPLAIGFLSIYAQASENIHCRSSDDVTLRLEMSEGKTILKEAARGQIEEVTPSRDYSIVWRASEVELTIDTKSLLSGSFHRLSTI